MTARLTTSLVAAVAALGLLAGCGGNGSGSDSTGTGGTGNGPATNGGSGGGSDGDNADDDLLGSVDTMFGTVEVPQPEDGDLTVVALGWSDAEMALALGVVPVATFDWQGFGEENKGVGPWATDLFGDVDPEIIERGDESLNYEQIQALDPDLILNTRSGNDEGEFTRLSEIAPTIFGPEGTGAYATVWTDQLALIGEATGKADEAAALIDDVEGQVAEAAQANPEFEGRTTASVAKFGDAYGAYLPGDGRFDILGELGFVNNPAIEDLESAGFYATVPIEQVSVFDADAIVVLPIGYTLAEAEADPLLQSLTVVSEDRAIFIDPDSELAGAWGASSVLSIPVVLEQLVPQLQEAVGRLG